MALTASEHLEDVCGGAKMTSWLVKWGGSGPHGFLWRLSGVTSTHSTSSALCVQTVVWASTECAVCAGPESPRCEFQMPASAVRVVGRAGVSLAAGCLDVGLGGERGPLLVGCIPVAPLPVEVGIGGDLQAGLVIPGWWRAL